MYVYDNLHVDYKVCFRIISSNYMAVGVQRESMFWCMPLPEGIFNYFSVRTGRPMAYALRLHHKNAGKYIDYLRRFAGVFLLENIC